MQLHEAVEVVQALSVTTANELLGRGWKLVAVSTSSDANGKQNPCYVLARAEGSPPLDGKPKKFEMRGIS